MKLMTKALEKKLPALYSTDDVPLEDKVIIMKFFNPVGAATWYIVEGDKEGNDYRLFGYADLGLGPGMAEWGNVMLSDLENVKLPFGMGIERDRGFGGMKFKEVA